MRHRVQNNQRLSCEFDELSEDNIFNQILKLTATILIKNINVDTEYKSELKKSLLYFGNVSDISVFQIKWSTLRFQRNNQNYKMLMNICYLVIDGLLLSTQNGEYSMATFIDDQHMHSLYESFIREYYRYHYGNEVSVSASFVDWDVPEGSEGIELLPKMKTDITLQKGEKTLMPSITATLCSIILIQTPSTQRICIRFSPMSKILIRNRPVMFQVCSYTLVLMKLYNLITIMLSAVIK